MRCSRLLVGLWVVVALEGASCLPVAKAEPPELPGAVEEGARQPGGDVGLTADEAQLADEVIGEYVASTRAEIVQRYDLDEQIRLLREEPRGFHCWNSVAAISECALACRKALVPLPASLDDTVVDLIGRMGLDNGGSDRTDREETLRAVLRALGFLGNKRALDTVVQLLGRGEEGLGGYSPEALMFIADERLVPVMGVQLPDLTRQYGPSEIRVLGHCGPSVLPILDHCAQSDDRSIRRATVEALLQMQDAAALPILERLKDDPWVDVREQAQAAWRLIHSREVDRILVLSHLDEEAQRRLQCLVRFAFRSFPPTVYWDHGYENSEALQALAALAPKSFGVLREVLTSRGHADGLQGPVHFTQPKVAELLVDLGEQSIPVLLDALLDQNREVSYIIVDALHRLTGQDFGSNYELWRDWYQEEGKRSA